jgi:hypothetical protein
VQTICARGGEVTGRPDGPSVKNNESHSASTGGDVPFAGSGPGFATPPRRWAPGHPRLTPWPRPSSRRLCGVTGKFND